MKRWTKILLIFQSVALIVLILFVRIQKTEAGRLKAEAECQADLANKAELEAQAQKEMADRAMVMAQMAQMEAQKQAELAHAEFVKCSSKK